MIKSEELMIGNYVMYEQTTHIVTEIRKDSILTRWISCDYEFECSLIWLKPIPITEEILLKLGIKYNTWNTRTRTKFIPGFFLKDSSEITYFKYGMRHKDIIVIKSVHQLQNLCFNVTQKHLTFIK